MNGTDFHASEFETVCEGSDYHFYPSFRTGRNVPKNGLFNYHVPRTGGITFNSVIASAFRVLCRSFGSNAQCIRFGETDDVEYLAEPDYRRHDAHRFANTPCIFVQTDWALGLHTTFRQAFDLVTFVRDPTTRIPSYYNYACRHADKQPNAGDFETFVRSPVGRNQAVRILSGDGNAADEGSVKKAIANLDERFTLFGTPADVDETIVWALSRYGAPNAITPRQNRSVDRYRFEANGYEELIRETNALDARLFEWVEANRRGPDLAPWREAPVSEVTLVFGEHFDPETRKQEQVGTPFGTAWLMERLREEPDLILRDTLRQDLKARLPGTG